MKREFTAGKIFLACLVPVACTLFMFSAANCQAFTVDMSPYTINVDSNRIGEIRVYTNLSYAGFIKNNGAAFIYFNECPTSIDPITATRDSNGNLILKFTLGDLLDDQNGYLQVGEENLVKVVISTTTGEDEGYGSVYLTSKAGP